MLLQLCIQNIYMWHQMVEKSQVEYKAPVLKPKKEATCITNTSFVLFQVFNILLKHSSSHPYAQKTVETILFSKFHLVCTDLGILMATQSSRHDTFFVE